MQIPQYWRDSTKIILFEQKYNLANNGPSLQLQQTLITCFVVAPKHESDASCIDILKCCFPHPCLPGSSQVRSGSHGMLHQNSGDDNLPAKETRRLIISQDLPM